jgi:hypothetical protein
MQGVVGYVDRLRVDGQFIRLNFEFYETSILSFSIN